MPLRIRQIPIVAASVCFAAGIAASKLTASTWRPTALLLAASLALTGLTLLALRRALRVALFPVLVLWFGAGIWCAQIQPWPSQQTELLAYSDGLSRTLQAHVVRIRELPPRNPKATDDLDRDFDGEELDAVGERTYSVDLALTSIEEVTPDISRMVPISGGVRATVSMSSGSTYSGSGSSGFAPPGLACGDLIEAPVRLHQPQRFRDPGVFQYADYLLTQDADGIAATTSIRPDKLKVVQGTALPWRDQMRCRVGAAQTWASGRMLAYLGSVPNRRVPPMLRLLPEDAATLNAMLFGDRNRLTHQLRLGFERTGSFHLFVVSGMHLGLLAGALLWITERLRFPRWIAALVTLACASGYAVLTGFGVPIRRALLMLAVFLCARLLFRQRFALNALGVAALVILINAPRTLFETSFQMTFLALVAIPGIATPVIGQRLGPWSYAASGLDLRWKDTAVPPRLAQLRVMLRLWGDALAGVAGSSAVRVPGSALRLVLWFLELSIVGLVADMVMVLPMALYFHRATVFSVPANMLSVPLVGAVATMGLATFCLSLASPWLAMIPAVVTASALHLLRGVIEAISKMHAADLRTPGPTLASSIAALVCIALCCWLARRSRLWALGPALLLPAAALVVLWPRSPVAGQDRLQVTAIDVGQGDSLLVNGPGGHTMLIDAGGPTGAAARAENASGTPAFDVGEEVVSPTLWSQGIRSLDVMVLSHAHSDHMGGMPAVLRNFRPRELWVAVDPASSAYRDLLAEAAEYGTAVRHLRSPQTLTWDGTSITVLAPAPAYTNRGAPSNNDSLVLRMQYGKASVLFEGDAEAPSEHAMLSAVQALGPVTLLKVGHHGSRTSTTPEFLQALAPADAVISVGRNNTFGHPRPEIIDRLAQAHALVFRTDRLGMTTFRLSPDGKISAETSASNP